MVQEPDYGNQWPMAAAPSPAVPESLHAQAILHDIGISGVAPSICISKVPRGFHCAEKPEPRCPVAQSQP